MLRTLFVTASCLLAAGPGLALQTLPPVDFSGTWVLDASRSDLPERGAGPRATPLDTQDQQATVLVIQQSATEIIILREGLRGTGKSVLPLDGRETQRRGPRGGTLTLKSRWEGTTLVTEGSQVVERPEGGPVTVTVREERSLGPDGLTLTVMTVSKGPTGEMRRRLVFRKKAE